MLLGMAAGAALGAVGVMAATQNQRQLRRTTRKVMKGAENAVLQPVSYTHLTLPTILRV